MATAGALLPEATTVVIVEDAGGGSPERSFCEEGEAGGKEEDAALGGLYVGAFPSIVGR
jgi:hypothetical protein